MKRTAYFTIILGLAFLFACNRTPQRYSVSPEQLLQQKQAPQLAEFLEQANPVVSEEDFPPMIVAPIVKDEKSQDLIIDIRRKDAYEAGHINGAYNMPGDSVLTFLQTINPAAYKRIVLVCYSGQTAAFYTTLLRLLGYKNAYALAYGMAGWNKDFGGLFKKNISAKYISRISRDEVALPEKGTVPQLAKGLPLQVLWQRVNKVAHEEPSEYLISADEVFANLDKYFIIDLRKPEHYKVGHIPGAVNIRAPQLVMSKDLSRLPVDKPIVVYCYHGYTSVSVTAYLRVLGYDVRSLKFGYHSFMDGILNRRIDFNTAFNEFPYITGSQRMDIKVSAAESPAPAQPKPTLNIPVKKKEVGGGCE